MSSHVSVLFSEGATWEGTKKDPKKEEKRRAILSMRDRTLAELYKTNPEAKAEVESADGYASLTPQIST